MVMVEKNSEKRNFLNWYCWYASQEEIVRAKNSNSTAIERLTSEYSCEIKKIDRFRRFCDFTGQPKGVLEEFHPLSCL